MNLCGFSRPSRSPRHRRGAALVVTLALLVLLTFLVVSFLTLSESSRRLTSTSNALDRADELLRSTTDFLAGQLAAEVRSTDKSTAVTGSGATANQTVYLPKTPADQLPQRAGITANASVNLVKMSHASAPALFTGGRAVFSGGGVVSTATPSLNGRFLNDEFWFGALGPQLGQPGGTGSVPDWIYVTKSGGVEPVTFDAARHTTGRVDEVVGRFAFVIYDVGGLMDLNVAGAPTGVAADEDAAGGHLAFADLAEVGISRDQVDEILQFRVDTLWDQPENFLDTVRKPDDQTGFHPADRGFRAVLPGQRPFLTRAQLIRFWRTKGWDADILEKAGTFTRDVEAPSFDPTILPFPASTSNRSKYAVDAGQTVQAPQRPAVSAPLSVRRFPLARLAWLETKSNNPSDSLRDTEIRESFGLEYDSGFGGWNYVEGDLTSGVVGFKIKTLAEVATIGRQPNFFEMLKAAIYPGSLGSNNPYRNGLLPTQSSLARAGVSPGYLFDQNTDLQILRIGANIIDQWDADSFPTEIRLGPIGFYGIEDLPYFSAVTFKAHRDVDATRNAQSIPQAQDLVDNPNIQYQHHVLFELWNPHQPGQNAASTPRPRAIRIRALAGTVESELTGNSGGSYPAISATSGNTTPTRYSTTFNGETMVASSDLQPDSFRSPSYVRNPADSTYNSTLQVNTFPLTPMNQLVWQGGNAPPNLSQGISATIRYYRPNNSVFSLEYERSPGQWRPYSGFHGFPSLPALTGWNTGPNFNNDIEALSGNTRAPYPQAATYPEMYANWYHHPEPRSNRWGGSRSLTPWPGDGGLGIDQGFLPMLTRSQLTVDGRPAASQIPWAPTFNLASDWYHQNPQWGIRSSPNNSSGAFGILQPTVASGSSHTHPGLLYRNDPASTAQYSYAPDPDGEVRPADGFFVPASNNPSVRSAPGAPLASTARPVILNRPFRSVAEMGHAYRDQPWKSLDFFSAKSADAGLLDFFCIADIEAEADEAPIAAGRISLNTPHPDVLAAMVAGISKMPGIAGSGTVTTVDARAIANTIVESTRSGSNPAPLRNRAELVARLAAATGLPSIGDTKIEREAMLRSLADVTQTRVWNLLIDLTVQSGRLAPGASGLEKFVVEGERRAWVEIAVDRHTGNILETNLTRPLE